MIGMLPAIGQQLPGAQAHQFEVVGDGLPVIARQAAQEVIDVRS